MRYNVEISEAVCYFVTFFWKSIFIVSKGGIGNDVEKKLFLNSDLSTIIVKSKMEW